MTWTPERGWTSLALRVTAAVAAAGPLLAGLLTSTAFVGPGEDAGNAFAEVREDPARQQELVKLIEQADRPRSDRSPDDTRTDVDSRRDLGTDGADGGDGGDGADGADGADRQDRRNGRDGEEGTEDGAPSAPSSSGRDGDEAGSGDGAEGD